jgi:hypothetical protein
MTTPAIAKPKAIALDCPHCDTVLLGGIHGGQDLILASVGEVLLCQKCLNYCMIVAVHEGENKQPRLVKQHADASNPDPGVA